jgi:D-alanine-D-alanine ligase
MKVLLLSGGRSAEWEISLKSAEFVRSVLENGRSSHSVVTVEIDADGGWRLDGRLVSIIAAPGRWKLIWNNKEVVFDIVFPVLHGPYGEDGSVQGFCMTANWPCAGADVMGSAIAINKITSRHLIESAGIPVVPWISFTRASADVGMGAITSIGYPCFVKPAHLGSSLGISKVKSPVYLMQALDKAFQYDPEVVVEMSLENARELEISVIGDGRGIDVSVIGEIEPGKEWYDYEAKYSCKESRLLIPAELDESVSENVRAYARKAFELIGGKGYARVDFFLSSKGELFLNELNTIPGFTTISMFPRLWEASDQPIDAILDRIMMDALRRNTALTGFVRGQGT